MPESKFFSLQLIGVLDFQFDPQEEVNFDAELRTFSNDRQSSNCQPYCANEEKFKIALLQRWLSRSSELHVVKQL